MQQFMQLIIGLRSLMFNCVHMQVKWKIEWKTDKSKRKENSKLMMKKNY